MNISLTFNILQQKGLKQNNHPFYLKAHSPRHDIHFFLGKVALLISWQKLMPNLHLVAMGTTLDHVK